MMDRLPALPLIVNDPYFSIWMPGDTLTDTNTTHWAGAVKPLRGGITVDGKRFHWLGAASNPAAETLSIQVTPTQTSSTLLTAGVQLDVRFWAPALPDDLEMLSAPITYVDLSLCSTDGKAHQVSLDFLASDRLCYEGEVPPAMSGSSYDCNGLHIAYTGQEQQKILGHSGDHITIDWGYLYMASRQGCVERRGNHLSFTLESTVTAAPSCATILLGYDDVASINYFGAMCRCWYMRNGKSIIDALMELDSRHDELQEACRKLDAKVMDEATAIGGEDYRLIACAAWRHTFGAHKLIATPDGEMAFLSKENDSNGCIGTVDVSYPSVPLFLLFNTEYVKGMLRPVFQFAACDSWEFDFAPHDVGRYPYAWGQVYGLNGKKGDLWFSGWNDDIFPPFYQYPAGTDIFEFRYQMPVEECGNMLLMTAAVCKLDGNALFAEPHMAVLKQWTQYLIKFGADPGEQLCTDDFAGHLSHNVNLSAKAIMGIEAYARLAAQLGRTEEAEEYHAKAAEMAKDWEKRAIADDHYVLAFGNADTWSLKYNLVWDKFFGSKLFSDEVYEKELKYYVKKTNEYGTPLDSRKDYTKSDWILWCASMAKTDEEAQALIAPVAHYLEATATRVPFSDWYETVTGEYCQFMGRSVQGGIFMPVLMKKFGQ